jgi:hypothetical protein
MLDLECANVAVAYEEFVRKNPGVKTNHGFSQQQLLEQMEAVRNEKTNTGQS